MENSVQIIKKYLAEKGITQFELARKINFHTSTINRWVTGKNKPSRLADEKIKRELSR
jgi:transcriptional regulator with XRE-family HTH domain